MMKYLVLVLGSIGVLNALNWQNTGELDKALYVYDIFLGQGNILYAAAKIDTVSFDSGWVFASNDLFTWQRTGDLGGDVKAVYSIIDIGGDTLMAGTRVHVDSPCVYVSSNHGQTWVFRSRVWTSGGRIGPSGKALLLDRNGILHAAHGYMGMSGYPPCHSHDRGLTWYEGPATSYNGDHYCLLEASDGALYCGTWGTGATPLKSIDQGTTWPGVGSMFDAGHCPAIVEGPAGVLYAGTYPRSSPQENIGRVFSSTDGGATWIEKGYGYFSTTTGVSALLRARDGKLYAGTRPNGEVFVSTDNGTTWSTTGTLSGAAIVYRIREIRKADSLFLYAATAPNGDVFRAFLYISAAVAEKPTAPGSKPRLEVLVNPTRGRTELHFEAGAGGEAVRLIILDAAGRRVRDFELAAAGAPRLRIDLKPGVYFAQLRTKTRVLTRKLVVE